MSGEMPGNGDRDPAAQPAPGWGTTPPTPPPPGGWVEPQTAIPTPPAPAWGPPPPPPPGWGPPPPPGWGPPPPPGWGNGAPHGWVPTYVQAAPKPGVIPLRPLGVGEILDGGFTTIRRYPGATLGLSAVVMIFVEAIQLAVTYYLLHGISSNASISGDNSDYTSRHLTVQLIVVVVVLIATVLLTGMVTTVVGQAVLGRTMGVGDAWQRTRPLVLRMLGATIVVTIVIALAAVVGALPGLVLVVIGAVSNADAATVAGVVFMIIGGLITLIYASVLLVMTTPSLVLEKLTIRAALSRSRALVRGSWWRVFGMLLLAQLIAGVIGSVIQVPFAAFGGGFSDVFSGNVGNQFHFLPLLLVAIGGVISGTLVRPFSAGVIALLYIDRRMRAEALDLTLQQAAADRRP